MDSKILVLGASGMLGSSLIKKFINKSISYISHSRKSNTDFNFELSDFKDVCKNLDEIQPEVIINLAANTDVDFCEKNPKIAFQDNTKSVENIVNWIKANDLRTKLIHISTDQVYDNKDSYSCENNVNISNTYAYSKYCAELHALGAKSIILRTNFFGKSIHNSRFSFSDWIVSSLSEGKKITLFKNILFNPISMNSLVDIISSNNFGLYNLGSKNGMSKAEFGIKLAESLNLSTQNISIDLDDKSNMFAYRPKDMRMNCDKFEKSFKISLNNLESELDILRKDYE